MLGVSALGVGLWRLFLAPSAVVLFVLREGGVLGSCRVLCCVVLCCVVLCCVVLCCVVFGDLRVR